MSETNDCRNESLLFPKKKRYTSEELCDRCHHLIDYIIQKEFHVHPGSERDLYESMYSSAVVAILSNADKYDCERDTPEYFHGHVRGAVQKYIYSEVYSFKSRHQFEKFCEAKKLFGEDWYDYSCQDEQAYCRMTGEGHEAFMNMIHCADVSVPDSLDIPKTLEDAESANGTSDVSDILGDMEIHKILAEGMKQLTKEQLCFTIDMCGFESTPLSAKQLKEKYHLTENEYADMLFDIRSAFWSYTPVRDLRFCY